MKKTKILLGIIWLIFILLYAQNINAWWNSDVVKTKLWGFQGDRFIAIGNDGTIHIVYEDSDRIVYAYKDWLLWHTEIVADTWYNTRNDSLSIAIDSNGNAHIIFAISKFIDPELELNIFYATNSSGSWVTETVGSYKDDHYVYISELVLDSNENPHISYAPSYYALWYAYKDNTGWKTETISDDKWFREPSMDLDSNDNPHIVYECQDLETGKDRIEYAYKDSTGWNIETIREDRGNRPSIVIDSHDNPLIGYTVFIEHHPVFYFSHQDSTGWHAEEFDDPEFCAWFSMALDADDNLHISYRCSSGFDKRWKKFIQGYTLKYAKRDGTQWHREVVDRAHTFAVPWLLFFINVFGNHIGEAFSMTLDLSGKPHIVYSKNIFDYFTLFYLFLESSEPSDSAGMTSLKHATRFGLVN